MAQMICPCSIAEFSQIPIRKHIQVTALLVIYDQKMWKHIYDNTYICE